MNLPRDRGAAARAAEGRARFWILGSLVVLALVSLAVPAALGYLQSRRFDYCREPAEALETSRRIQEYFSANRDALARGALLLASPDTGVLNGDLRVLLRILEDDYLLEVPVHRRAAGDKGGVFSAHEWLAGEGSAPLRSRLAELANHDLLPIRSQAFRALSLIGLKVPESLSEAPFPAFRREHLRGLLVVAEGEPLPPGIEIRSFLREVLLSPMTLRLWQNAAQPGTAQSLALALRAVLALEDTSDGDLADAVCKSPDVDGPVRVLQAMALARAEDERAWRRLLRIAAADTAVPQRMAALEALRSCAPPEAIQGLRELASRERHPPILDKLQESVEHIAGERILDWNRLQPEPGRLPALKADVNAVEATERALSALRYLGLHPALARKDPAVERLVRSFLGCSDVRLRTEAVRAAGKMGAVEALDRPGAPDDRGWPARSLLDLLADADLRVAGTAAAALLRLTGYWPEDEAPAGEDQSPGCLSPEVAASPPRLGMLVRGFESWWSKRGNENQADWYLAAIASGNPTRAAAGARGIAVLARRRLLPADWTAANRSKVLASYAAATQEVKTALLAAFAELGDGADAEALWKLYLPAFHAEPAEAWEVAQALSRLLSRGGARGTALLDALIAKLSELDGAPAAVLAQFLDARFHARLIDERILDALRRLRAEGASPAAPRAGTLRANLARWFPRAPTTAGAQALVDLLADPEVLVRFWALAHLKDLAGTDHGYDEKAVGEPPAPEVLERWRRWAAARSDGGSGKSEVEGSRKLKVERRKS